MQPDRSQFRTSRAFDAALLIILVLGIWQAGVHRVAVGDWLFFRSYHPTPEIVALANRIDYTAEGRRLFYRGDPEIITGSTQRDSLCGQKEFGCLASNGQIIIYDPTSDANNEIVTAAHETLHLAYRRYDAATRSSVDALISNAFGQLRDSPSLQKELGGYTGDDRLDEAHSYIGTEYPAIPPDLEGHYKHYFKDRSLIVTAYETDPGQSE